MAVTGILGKKVGMTQLFDERGDVHPVTVLKAGPCVITQLKTLSKDGYDAAQIGYVDFIKASKVNKPMTGHFAKSNVPPVRMMKEVAVEVAKEGDDAAVKAGDRVMVDIFPMISLWTSSAHRRAAGLPAWSPASLRRRSEGARTHVPGAGLDRRIVLSVARLSRPAHARPHGPRDQITVRNLRIRGIDKEENLLMVEGAVPGPRDGICADLEGKGSAARAPWVCRIGQRSIR
jgi:large subunit ribosomal protein L3